MEDARQIVHVGNHGPGYQAHSILLYPEALGPTPGPRIPGIGDAAGASPPEVTGVTASPCENSDSISVSGAYNRHGQRTVKVYLRAPNFAIGHFAEGGWI